MKTIEEIRSSLKQAVMVGPLNELEQRLDLVLAEIRHGGINFDEFHDKVGNSLCAIIGAADQLEGYLDDVKVDEIKMIQRNARAIHEFMLKATEDAGFKTVS